MNLVYSYKYLYSGTERVLSPPKKQKSRNQQRQCRQNTASGSPRPQLLRRIPPRHGGGVTSACSPGTPGDTARRPARHRPPRPRGCDDRPAATDDPAGARTFVCVGSAGPAGPMPSLFVGRGRLVARACGFRAPVPWTHVTGSPVCPLQLMMTSTGVNKAPPQ